MNASFNRVYEGFRRRLTPEQRNMFQYATRDDLRDAIEDIQKAQAQRHGLRNLNKLKHFLHGLEQYTGVVEVFVQVKPAILGLIWGPIKFCLQVASRTVNAFDALLDAYKRIGESLPILSAVEGIFYSKPHVQQVLANIYEDILDFHKRSVVFFSHGTWRLTLKLIHHTLEDMFGDVLKNLERSRGLLMESASVAYFQDSQQARLFFMADYKERIEKDKKTRMRVVVEWLSADQSHKYQQEALQHIRHELPESGTWIHKHPLFKDWLQEDKGKSLVFWLTGIPGAGKTVLFSSVIDQINKSYPTSETVYFYCKTVDPNKSTFKAVAQSLISQILHKDTTCLEYLYDTIIASKESRPGSSALLKQILEELVICRSSFIIAIDGLDECEKQERSEIFSVVSNLAKKCNTEENVKFFLSSRREEDIKLFLAAAYSLSIEPEYNESDIRAYVNLLAKKLSNKFGFDAAKEREIAREVMKRPEGMFLLARLIMENLLAQDTIVDLEEELQSDILPNGIDEAYGRLLVRIGKSRPGKIGPEKSRHRAALVLSILATAKRPLTVHELQGAISISLIERNVDLKGRQLRDSFQELCGPIIEPRLNGIIELIHPTARTYLVQNYSGPYMDLSHAKFQMALLCVSYLNFDCFCLEASEQKIGEYSSNGSYAFQQYAVCNWIQHVKSLGNCWQLLGNSDCTLVYNACKVLLQRDMPDYSFEIAPSLKLEKPPYSALHKALCALHSAYESAGSITEHGIPLAMQHMCQVRMTVEDLFSTSDLQTTRSLLDSYGPLLFKCPIVHCPSFQQGFMTQSARDNHYRIHEPPFKCPHKDCEYAILGFLEELTLKNHLRLCHDPVSSQITFPKVKSRSVEDALNKAIDEDDITAINTLATELSSVVDRKKGFLLRAVENGSEQAAVLISTLLGTKEDLAHKVRGRTAVSVAVANGYAEVLKVLLNGCDSFDTSYRNPYGQTALRLAASSGYKTVVGLLIDKGADVNLKDKDGMTLLHLAARNRHEGVVWLLIDKGAKVNLKDKDGMTLLHFAARNGHDGAVRLLIVKGADFSLKDINGTTALHEAAINGHEGVVRLLIDKGSDFSLKRNNGMTALHEAARYGHEAVVRLLIDKGADPSLRSSYGETALHLAARNGDEGVVRLLIDKGSDFSLGGIHGATALHFAARNGHDGVVRLLLDKGADFSLKDINGTTALHEAAINGHEGVVRLLIDKGPDFSLKRNNGMTALHEAARYGHEAVVRLLIDKGADTSLIDAFGMTALHAAARNGQEIVVRLLINKSADPSLGSNYGETALHLAARNGHEGVVRLLIDKGVDPNLGGKYGETALHEAAKNGHEAVLRLLIDKGADFSLEDINGNTALQAAAKNGHEAIVQLLIDKEACPI